MGKAALKNRRCVFSQHIGTLGEMSPLLVKRLFAVFDKDGSGSVDQQEFLAGVAACCSGSKEEKMALAFVRPSERAPRPS